MGGCDQLVMVVGSGGCWRWMVCVLGVVVVCCMFVVSWSLWLFVFVGVSVCGRYGHCHRSQGGWSLSVVMCLDGGGKEKRNTSRCHTNIVCYPQQINNKQMNHSSRMPFQPIPGNIPV